MQIVKESLAIQFKMTDMGKLHYCLGVTVVQDEKEKCLLFHQEQLYPTVDWSMAPLHRNKLNP